MRSGCFLYIWNSLQLIRSQRLIARNRSYFNILMPFVRVSSLQNPNVFQSCLKCSPALLPIFRIKRIGNFSKSSIYFILAVVDLCYLLAWVYTRTHSHSLSISHNFSIFSESSIHKLCVFVPILLLLFNFFSFACLFSSSSICFSALFVGIVIGKVCHVS